MTDDATERLSVKPIIDDIVETIDKLREAGRREAAKDEPDQQRLVEIRRGILGLEGTCKQLEAMCLALDPIDTQYIDPNGGG